MFNSAEHEKVLTVGIFYSYDQVKFHAHLSWAWKKFYNLGAWSNIVSTSGYEDRRPMLAFSVIITITIIIIIIIIIIIVVVVVVVVVTIIIIIIIIVVVVVLVVVFIIITNAVFSTVKHSPETRKCSNKAMTHFHVIVIKADSEIMPLPKGTGVLKLHSRGKYYSKLRKHE